MPPPTNRPPPISTVMPPLILGTATFNTQYHPSPSLSLSLPIVQRALQNGITAFDTSPYYGPSEHLLGAALRALAPPRSSLFLITKAGRVGPTSFDYSPEHIRHSIRRSLKRLGTPYLDLVYCHDVEFYPPEGVLSAVRELRRIRDEEGTIKYVGICGYPIHQLSELANLVYRATGEPLDAVQSYSHFCVQNTSLANTATLDSFLAAGVPVLTNASMLSMGLLTTRGADTGPQAAWHPAPSELRIACRELAIPAQAAGEKLEDVAIRWALRNWALKGAAFGTSSAFTYPPLSTSSTPRESNKTRIPTPKIGISVMGVTTPQELDETTRAWHDILHEYALLTHQNTSPSSSPSFSSSSFSGLQQQAITDNTKQESKKLKVLLASAKINRLVEQEMWPRLGSWKDYAWKSPDPGFVNTRREFGVLPEDYDSPEQVRRIEEGGNALGGKL